MFIENAYHIIQLGAGSERRCLLSHPARQTVATAGAINIARLMALWHIVRKTLLFN